MDPTPSLLSFGEAIALVRQRLNVSSGRAAEVIREALKSRELRIIRDDHIDPISSSLFAIVSKTAAQAVEQNMEKARGAMDNYFSFLQNIWGSNDLTEKMKTYTARNISASTDCMHKLSQAKNFQEAFRIQTEFMQTQLISFAEQARSLGEVYTKAAMDATKRFGMSA